MVIVNDKISPVNVEERKKADIRPGDTVRVMQKIKEGDKTRLQAFEGIVIARKHGSESGATFTVRKVASGVGVEKIFPLYSPMIDKVEVVKNPAAKYKHGAGPIVVKTLVDMNINAAASREFGVGSSTLLQMYNIRKIKVKPNITVDKALPDILKQLKEKEVN